MYQTIAIEAQYATVGSQLFSRMGNEPPAYWWHRIKDVRLKGDHVEIDAGGFTTWKHPWEAITVRKWVEVEV